MLPPYHLEGKETSPEISPEDAAYIRVCERLGETVMMTAKYRRQYYHAKRFQQYWKKHNYGSERWEEVRTWHRFYIIHGRYFQHHY